MLRAERLSNKKLLGGGNNLTEAWRNGRHVVSRKGRRLEASG